MPSHSGGDGYHGGARRRENQARKQGECTSHIVAAICRTQVGLAAAQLFSYGMRQPSSSVSYSRGKADAISQKETFACACN